MSIELAKQMAEAGMRLARSRSIHACAQELVAQAIILAGAQDAAFVGFGKIEHVQFGSPPTSPLVSMAGSSAGQLLADDGEWVAVCVQAPAGYDGWRGILWLMPGASKDGRKLAQILAQQAGVGFVSVLRGEELEFRAMQHLALVEAGKSLSQQHTLEAVLRRIIDLAVELVGAKYGALGVIDAADPTQLSDFVTTGMSAEVEERIGSRPKGKGLLGVLIHDPRPLRMRDISEDPRSVGFPSHHPPMKSFLGVPIQTRRATMGRIYLTEKLDGAEFTAADEQIVITLASQAAIAIESADLYEELQRTAEALENASHHKSAFLASMSHELRSPLNTIIGYTRLLFDEPENLSPDQLEDLSIIRTSGDHLLRLISDLLDLSKIEAGKLELHVEQVDVADIVTSVVAALKPEAKAAGLALSCEIEGDLSVECDPGRVRQMLLNAAGNAVKFTTAGSVVISARRKDDAALIDVVDTGPGIPAEDISRIFESFFQSHDAMGRTPRAREGAGLGLAITRMLAELHGGSVSIASLVGQGTTVTMTLPVQHVEGALGGS